MIPPVEIADAKMVGRFVKYGRRKDSPGWIVQANGCHIWTGACCGRDKRASVRADGRMQYAYRVRYEREIGPVPDGMELDHFVCDNPRCVNPHHVRPVTHRENMLRGNKNPLAWHVAKTHCPQGHRLEGDNLERYALERGGRKCKTCKADRARRQRLQLARAA